MSDKAHRIPEDFALTDERRAYARKYRIANPDDVFADFYEYWLNKQGLQAKKLNWDLAWQTWVRKDAKWNPPKDAPIPPQPMKVAPRTIVRAEVLDLDIPVIDQEKREKMSRDLARLRRGCH